MDSHAGLFAVLFAGGFALAFMAFMLGVFVVSIVALWKIFAKAGRPGWAALVPGYNCWVYAEIVGLPGPAGLVVFAPLFLGWLPLIGQLLGLATLGFFMYMSYRLAKVFGMDQLGTVLLVIPCISVIGMLMLAFSDKEYLGAEAAN